MADNESTGGNSDDLVCRKFRVTGRVQGVFFRAGTQTTARDLGITGYAANKDDGSVEVLACGGVVELDNFAKWLKQGPPMAQVRSVEVSLVDYQELEDFSTA